MKKSSTAWCEYEWNPITGCRNRCPYCSAHKVAARFSGDIRRNRIKGRELCTDSCYILKEKFTDQDGRYLQYPFGYEPTFHIYRTGDEGIPAKIKKPANIYVGSAGECFGSWIPNEWIELILQECRAYDRHNYLFLTKYPERYEQLWKSGLLNGLNNCWLGRTVTSGRVEADRLVRKVPVFINFEPLNGEIYFQDTDKKIADWFIIGDYKSNGTSTGRIKKEWIENITAYADRHGIPVFYQNNIRKYVGREHMRKELPPELAGIYRRRQENSRLADDCVICREHKNKQDMIAILAKSVRGEAPRKTAYLCRKCFEKTCGEWQVSLPELEVFKR